MNEWRDISEAPKSGEFVLLWSPDNKDEQAFIGQWREDDSPWGGSWWPDYEASFPIDCDPTHWQPLPDPPSTDHQAQSSMK